MNRRKLLLPALVLALAPMARAQFGSGIVYDPTQSAHAIQQIEQGSQLYTTAVATRDQIVTMYNLAYQMSQLLRNLEARYIKSALSASPGLGGFHFAKFADLILVIAFGFGRSPAPAIASLTSSPKKH